MTAIPISQIEIQRDIDALKQANRDTKSIITDMQDNVSDLVELMALSNEINREMYNILLSQNEILERIESKM